VSDAGPDPDTRQRFLLRAPSPVRALATASVCAVVGAVLLVLWAAHSWPLVVAVVAVLLLAFGLALVLAAVLAQMRLQQTVEVTPEGVTLGRGRGRRMVRWSDIAAVKLVGARLVLEPAQPAGSAAELLNPGGSAEPTFLALLAALQHGLDRDRGYRPLE